MVRLGKHIFIDHLFLIEVDYNASCDFTSSQGLHRLVKPRKASDFGNTLQKPSTCILESRGGIVHRSYESSYNGNIVENIEVRVGS